MIVKIHGLHWKMINAALSYFCNKRRDINVVEVWIEEAPEEFSRLGLIPNLFLLAKDGWRIWVEAETTDTRIRDKLENAIENKDIWDEFYVILPKQIIRSNGQKFARVFYPEEMMLWYVEEEDKVEELIPKGWDRKIISPKQKAIKKEHITPLLRWDMPI